MMFKVFENSRGNTKISELQDKIDEHIQRHTDLQKQVREEIQNSCTFFRENNLEKYLGKDTADIHNSICNEYK